MSQKFVIAGVRVEGASPFLGLRTVGQDRVPVWSSDPDLVVSWLCDGSRARFNQVRSRRKKYGADKTTLVPIGPSQSIR